MSETTRRQFLPGLAALPAMAKSKPVAKARTRVLGANDRINVAFIGNGMQFYGLLERGFHRRKKEQNDFHYAAVCDVWQPRIDHAQKATGAEKTYRDYREIIARPDIDGVVIAVPDHWHYPMASQALLAGKDVYLEKPMTYTVDEAAKLNDLVERTKARAPGGRHGARHAALLEGQRVHPFRQDGQGALGPHQLQPEYARGHVGLPDPRHRQRPLARRGGRPGRNLDWNMWLGPARKRAFSKERYFRWRKFWDYSGGNATDLLYHRLGMMSTMLGFDFPTRVTGAGGIYVQKNREVPDTYMTMIEYPGDYAVNMISCMGNSTSVPLTVYGNWATLQITDPPATTDAMGDQRRGSGPRRPQVALIKPERPWLKEFREANGGKTEVMIEGEPSKDLIDDWLDCMRSRGTPVYNVLRGYQVMAAIKMGVDSYRAGRVLYFDPATRRVTPNPPPHREYLPKEA